jgi:tetratricopeptide (TPR) repeat protein
VQRKLKKLGFLLWVICFHAQAKDFAHCSLANQQLKLLNDFLEPEIRIRASQSLITDIEELKPHIIKNTSGLPTKLIQLCYNIKKRAFQATFVKGGPALYGSYDFLLAAGKYFFFEKIWATSHEAFENAAKLRPNYFEPNYLALQAWVYTQIAAEKPVPAEAYQRKVRSYVDNMLKSKDIRPDEKRLILGFLAGAEEKSSKIYTARAMLESSVALNPADLNARLQLGELEERAGRFVQSKKVYEDALALKIEDPMAKKKIYVRLARVYALFGELDKLDDVLKKALLLDPKDPYFLELSKRRSLASVKKQSN